VFALNFHPDQANNPSLFTIGSAGFNVFDNLYISETSYVAVAEELEYIPKPKAVVGEGGITFRRIATEEAPSDFGEVVTRLPGTTVDFEPTL
jgi:hypothetical protein